MKDAKLRKWGLVLALIVLAGLVAEKANHTTIWYIGFPLVLLLIALTITALLIIMGEDNLQGIVP